MMKSPELKDFGWKQWAGVFVVILLVAYLVFKIGSEILILFGIGSVGTYSYRARKRVDAAKRNVEKAEKAAARLKRRYKDTKQSREKLDELREILAEKEAKSSTVEWDKQSAAPPPNRLD